MIIYLFDARDLDRCGPDITLLKSTRAMRDIFSVDDKSRNEVVHRVLELDCKTIVVPDDRYRCSPAMVTVVDVLRQLGFLVLRISEYLQAHSNCAPAAKPAAPPAGKGAAVGQATPSTRASIPARVERNAARVSGQTSMAMKYDPKEKKEGEEGEGAEGNDAGTAGEGTTEGTPTQEDDGSEGT